MRRGWMRTGAFWTVFCVSVCMVLTACRTKTAADAEEAAGLPRGETILEEDGGEESTAAESMQQTEKIPVPDNFLEGIDLTGGEALQLDFKDASVHDPSVIRVDDTWYVFGSHLAAAKSEDLMNWKLIASGVKEKNPIIPNAMNEMKEAFTWARTGTFWAPDVIQLADGKFYMYYCNCEGSSPLSALGLAVADQVEGPYRDLGVFLKSGQNAAQKDENGDIYDATQEPNVVDPDVFFDQEGRLWMVYGSYSGGIFTLELNPETGLPLESGYGKKLLGANHLRIEAPYMLYSPETDYYYLFLSFGGLAADGGYNIRVCRSKNPDGPFTDSLGQDMIDCQGADGTFFDDEAAAKYGTKLMGNFSFPHVEGENGKIRSGYISPGHNSAYYDEETGQYFLIFHSRFEGRGESHQIRVHQMFLNEDGWFVVSPYRYAQEALGSVEEEDIAGPWKYLNHQHDITAGVKNAQDIMLHADHTVTGAVNGSWELLNENDAVLILDGVIYKGKWILEYDSFGKKKVMTFTALNAETGVSVWGSGYEAK